MGKDPILDYLLEFKSLPPNKYNLRGVDLRETDLNGVSLKGVNLKRANLERG